MTQQLKGGKTSLKKAGNPLHKELAKLFEEGVAAVDKGYKVWTSFYHLRGKEGQLSLCPLNMLFGIMNRLFKAPNSVVHMDNPHLGTLVRD